MIQTEEKKHYEIKQKIRNYFMFHKTNTTEDITRGTIQILPCQQKATIMSTFPMKTGLENCGCSVLRRESCRETLQLPSST